MFVSAKRKQQIKVGSRATVSGTVYSSYPILPFGIVTCALFVTTFHKMAVYKCLSIQYIGGGGAYILEGL